jgi:probable addiction module antidote protein
MTIKTYPFNVYDELKTEKDIEMFVEASIEEAKNDSDPSALAHCLEIAARAQGMLEVSRKTGLNRAGLYRSLKKGGNPTIATFGKIANALGYRITLVPIDS